PISATLDAKPPTQWRSGDGADHDRRSLGTRSPGTELAIYRLVELPTECHVPGLDQGNDDFQSLRKAADSMVEGKPERAVLRLVPAGAKRQHESAGGDLVDRVGHLGDERRIAPP